MNRLSANTGWLWVKQGFRYFRLQPLEFSTLFLGYLFCVLLLGFIPVIGQIIAFVLLPQFTLAFMQACKEIDQGRRAHPRLLFYGFRSPQAGRLVQLGMLYFIAAVIVLAASILIDGGAFWEVMTSQKTLTAKHVEDANMTGAMLFSMLLYMPALMAFWFAGPLIVWHNMPLPKAVFYSFVATKRNISAFLVYGLAWFGVGGILPTLFSLFIATLLGNPALILLIMMPVSMLITIILYCSFYPTYKSVFDQTTDNEIMP